MAFACPALPVSIDSPFSHSTLCCAKFRPSRRRFLQTALSSLSIPIIYINRGANAGIDAVTSKTASSINTVSTSESASAAESVAAASKTSKKPVWGYEGDIGPEYWAKLSEEVSQCIALGDQSPIDLSYRSAIPAGLSGAENERPTITTNPATFVARWREVSPGAIHRSLVVEQYIQPPPPLVGDAPPIDTYTPPPRAALLELPGLGEYVFQSFHFHSGGSEHTFDGRKDDMEAHFVFQKRFSLLPKQSNKKSETEDSTQIEDSSKSNSIASAYATSEDVDSKPIQVTGDTPKNAVIAVLFRSGETDNSFFSTIAKNAIPTLEAAADFPSAGVTFDLDLADVLPSFEFEELYNYIGSLTTPPCTPNIHWTVLSRTAIASGGDIDALTEAQGGPNLRPIQPLNDRPVTRFVAEARPAIRNR